MVSGEEIKQPEKSTEKEESTKAKKQKAGGKKKGWQATNVLDFKVYFSVRGHFSQKNSDAMYVKWRDEMTVAFKFV